MDERGGSQSAPLCRAIDEERVLLIAAAEGDAGVEGEVETAEHASELNRERTGTRVGIRSVERCEERLVANLCRPSRLLATSKLEAVRSPSAWARAKSLKTIRRRGSSWQMHTMTPAAAESSLKWSLSRAGGGRGKLPRGHALRMHLNWLPLSYRMRGNLPVDRNTAHDKERSASTRGRPVHSCYRPLSTD